MQSKTLKISAILFAVIAFSGCDLGFQTMGATEHGVKFSTLPTFIGGGLGKKVTGPGEKEFVWPWEKLYRINTGFRSIEWGGVGEGDNKTVEDYVQTRLIDGNEVSLGMTVRYRVIPQKVSYVIQNVGSENAVIDRLVSAVARSDIRTYINELHTEVFLTNAAKRDLAVNRVREGLNARLVPEGIEIESVIFNTQRFVRTRNDGTTDDSLQEQINKTQGMKQRVQQELFRVRTIEEEMKRKFAEASGKYNQLKEQVDGELRQAYQRGDSKLAALKRDAERVKSVGGNEIEAMKKEIQALAGPGGRALIRREVAQALIERDPKFVVLSSGGTGSRAGAGVDISRVDTNELIRQAGIFAAASEKASSDRTNDVAISVPPANVPSTAGSNSSQ